MASSRITSCHVDGETVETVTNFISLHSKFTVDGDCCHEIKKKKKLAPWKKSYEKPRQHVKNQRHHFADKCLYNQTMVFPVVTYGYESWVIKMTEGQRIDAFELWLEKTLFFFFF